MGLDLDCNGLSVRVGSYGSVRYVRHFLIDAIKKYIEASNEFNNRDKTVLLEGIEKCYTDNTEIGSLNLKDYGLNGFECFIHHSDCDGIIRPYDASDFVDLCDKLNDYFDKTSHYFDDDKFYLYDIFKESANSGEDIIFC